MEAKEVAFIFVLLFSSLLNAFYFLPIVHKAFFEGAPEGEEASHKGLHPVPQSLGAAAAKGHDHPLEGPIREPSYFLVVPLLLCAVISVVLGIYPEFLLDLIKLVVK